MCAQNGRNSTYSSQQHQEKLTFYDRTTTTTAAAPAATTTTTRALKVSDFTQVGFTVIPPQIFKQIPGRTKRSKEKVIKRQHDKKGIRVLIFIMMLKRNSALIDTDRNDHDHPE